MPSCSIINKGTISTRGSIHLLVAYSEVGLSGTKTPSLSLVLSSRESWIYDRRINAIDDVDLKSLMLEATEKVQLPAFDIIVVGAETKDEDVPTTSNV